MDLKEIKIELIKQDKTMSWLAYMLKYSTSYLYESIREQKPLEILRIKRILKIEDK